MRDGATSVNEGRSDERSRWLDRGMTQSAVARFEAGGTVPTPMVLERLARALNMGLDVTFAPRADAA
ncbi:helix-turn-helix domain-containing protein [Micromonospora sp. NPDC001898]|uniref:helix-turn-helix domain-containing protein n=1 Tax=Micromonospora sp. NPDC001898 TaxID=3364221 RepID=UPI0036A050B2